MARNNRAAGLAQAASGLYQISDSFMDWEDRNRSRQYLDDQNRQREQATAAKAGMNEQDNMTDLAIAEQNNQTDLEIERRRGENELTKENLRGNTELDVAQTKGKFDIENTQAQSQGQMELEKVKNAFMMQKERAARFTEELKSLNQQADRLAFQISQMPGNSPGKKKAFEGYNQLRNLINQLTESELESYDDSANYISQFTPTPIGGNVATAVIDQPAIDKYHQTRAQITETLNVLGAEDVMGDYQFIDPEQVREREKLQMEGNQKLAVQAMTNAGIPFSKETYNPQTGETFKGQSSRPDASAWVTQSMLLNESMPMTARQTQAAPDEGTPVFTQSGSTGKALNKEKMWEYLTAANYNLDQAKALAKQDGYDPDNIQ